MLLPPHFVEISLRLFRLDFPSSLGAFVFFAPPRVSSTRSLSTGCDGKLPPQFFFRKIFRRTGLSLPFEPSFLTPTRFFSVLRGDFLSVGPQSPFPSSVFIGFPRPQHPPPPPSHNRHPIPPPPHFSTATPSVLSSRPVPPQPPFFVQPQSVGLFQLFLFLSPSRYLSSFVPPPLTHTPRTPSLFHGWLEAFNFFSLLLRFDAIFSTYPKHPRSFISHNGLLSGKFPPPFPPRNSFVREQTLSPSFVLRFSVGFPSGPVVSCVPWSSSCPPPPRSVRNNLAAQTFGGPTPSHPPPCLWKSFLSLLLP